MFLYYLLLPQQGGIRVLYFERNKTFSIPATKEQSDFEFLRNSSSPPLDFVQCKTTHPLMKNLASFFDTEDDAVFADKTKRRSTPRRSR